MPSFPMSSGPEVKEHRMLRKVFKGREEKRSHLDFYQSNGLKHYKIKIIDIIFLYSNTKLVMRPWSCSTYHLPKVWGYELTQGPSMKMLWDSKNNNFNLGWGFAWNRNTLQFKMHALSSITNVLNIHVEALNVIHKLNAAQTLNPCN